MPADAPGDGGSGGRGLSFQVGLVVASRFIVAIMDLVAAVVLVRLLAKDDYGALALLLVLHLTVGNVLTLGVPQSVLYFVPTVSAGARRTFVLQTVGVLGVLGALAGAGTLVLGLGFSDRFLGGRADLAGLVPLVALALLLDYPARAHQQTLIALDRHGWAAAVNVVLALAGVAALAVPAALGRPLQEVLVAWCAVAGLKTAVGVGVPLLAFSGVRREPFPGGVGAQLGYAVPIGLAGIVGSVNVQVDKLLVAGFFGATIFAEYAVAARELPLVSILPYTVASTILPRLVALAGDSEAGGPAASVELWHVSIRKVALVMLPVACFLAAVAEPVVVLLYTRDYAAATPVFLIYLCVLPLRVTSYGVMTQALGRPRYTLYGAFVAVASNLALSLVLIRIIGHLGPPVGTVASQVLTIGFFLVVIGRMTGTGPGRVFPWGAWLRTFLVAAAPALPVAWAASAGLPPGLLVPAGAVLYLAAYLALARGMRLIGPEETAWLKSWLTLDFLRR